MDNSIRVLNCTALFQATECPCDALYTERDGAIHRIQDAGTVRTHTHTELHNTNPFG